MPSPIGLVIRTAEDADWPAMVRLAATSFGSFRPREANDMWRTLIPADGVVVACDGGDVVGMAYYLDLRLTVPGGAVLPMAGVSWVCVAPTHRRRGVLREMFAELHGRMTQSHYPIAGLEASEGAIYGRFGYGQASVVETLRVDRRGAEFLDEVPDPGGVRIVAPVEHRDRIEEIYERWRVRTPGGLFTPREMWDEVFGDREVSRRGGGPLMALLHDDGFALYRIHGDNVRKSVVVTKLAAVTDDAYVALWRALVGMDLMDAVTVDAPPGELLPYLLTDARRVGVTGREDGLWLRMLDVPAVLEARSYAADATLVLDVSDGLLGGGGRFAIKIRDGRARCEPSDAEPDVWSTLSVLGSLYLGQHRASAFAAANRLRCSDSGVVALLDAAFASDVPAELGFGF
ncbi:enhanced intracellular survival protein Eis [Mycolicibacterium sp. P1-18]|uniref:enhanced intracellular survival protein Eis n=1 Tax=Mycolicibacterium sp. P1-18 TaxID=2024615 RepID=UPI0011F1B2BE|nr:enhanced intracellular survival protein Eis [Mycolicibacterium sp. P1-18]KAA0099740.1 enhanced intracellular survival protein Eis [Mycolicibacterium sp. P1-18]